jgi:hypothetical protein
MAKLTLKDELDRSGMSSDELHMRYFAIGGQRTALEVEAFVYGAMLPDSYEHDLIAQALNDDSRYEDPCAWPAELLCKDRIVDVVPIQISPHFIKY